jgi:hypothetical protein
MVTFAPRDIGGTSAIKSMLDPNDQAAAGAFSLVGTAIDMANYHSAEILVAAGAAVGGPATIAIDAKLQESADGSTGWTDCATGPGNSNPAVAITQITAASTRRFLRIDKSPYKRFLRLAFTVAFTGGASPKLGLQASAALGGGIGQNPPTQA